VTSKTDAFHARRSVVFIYLLFLWQMSLAVDKSEVSWRLSCRGAASLLMLKSMLRCTFVSNKRKNCDSTSVTSHTRIAGPMKGLQFVALLEKRLVSEFCGGREDLINLPLSQNFGF